MKKILFCLLLLFALCVNAFAACTFIQRDTSPRYELIYEVINPKFVPQNFSSDSLEEVRNYKYQIPDSLLTELTTEELALYTMDYPAFITTSPSVLKGENFTDFNGFVELTMREHWIEDLTYSIEKYHSEGKDALAIFLAKFLSSYYVFTRMSLTQQKCLMQTIKNTLDGMIIRDTEENHNVNAEALFYYTGLMLQSYYPGITNCRISDIAPFMFLSDYEVAKGIILIALQKAIQTGDLVEARREK